MNRLRAVGSKPYTKLAIDIVLTTLLLVLMANDPAENGLHEILGLFMFALFILHHILNPHWYKAVFRKKQGLTRALQNAADILLFLAMIGVMASSIVVSRRVFTFMNVRSGLFARKLHASMTTWCFLLMAVHVGCHWSMVMSVAKKAMKSAHSRMGVIVARLTAASIAAIAFGAIVCDSIHGGACQ